MKKHRQEEMAGWIGEAGESARAGDELQIERWVVNSIGYRKRGLRSRSPFSIWPARVALSRLYVSRPGCKHGVFSCQRQSYPRRFIGNKRFPLRFWEKSPPRGCCPGVVFFPKTLYFLASRALWPLKAKRLPDIKAYYIHLTHNGL